MRYTIAYYLFYVFCFGCKKSSFLEKVPNDALISPTTIDDLKALTDNTAIFNGAGGFGISPFLGECAADNYYILPMGFGNLDPSVKNLYVWNDDIYLSPKYDWSYPYRAVFYANVILDQIPLLEDPAGQNDINIVKGRALYFRSEMLYKAAQIFAPPYNQSTASTDISIPIKTGSDANETIAQSKNDELYSRILDDLRLASQYLPDKPAFKNQPSKWSCYGLLSRIYLNMRIYDSAYYYSRNCLEIDSVLMDFNNDPNVRLNLSNTFVRNNPEVIIASLAITSGINDLFSTSRYRVDSNLVYSYIEGDLRKKAFFTDRGNGYTFKGSYDGSSFFFTGISTNEIYLVKAESAARLGYPEEAMTTLNTLLKKRWLNSMPFIDLVATTGTEALEIILKERRKDLLFRGLRWEDLRRLNQEGQNISITRTIADDNYVLLPNDSRYTFLIPPDVMTYHPNWKQNER